MYIVGVKNFVVEVDAKYIKGMINNPDIQPSATINRWIAGILLFDFKLRHVPAKDHVAADGLSRRPGAPENPEDEGDVEEWIEQAYSFGTACLNDYGLDSPRDMEESSRNSQIQFTQTKSLPKNSPQSAKEEYAKRDGPGSTRQVLEQDVLTIPQSSKAIEREARMDEIKEFLKNPEHKKDMSQQEFTRLIKRATKFFILDDRIWKKDRLGKHKLVIERERRLGNIRQAHDHLGHKGVFTVRTRIGQRFWWPSMDDDIKWYIKTCHECQVRLVKKIMIPPTVAKPHGLFRKVYIDTMLMPKAKGY
jgi:Integrase zinc binding domain